MGSTVGSVFGSGAKGESESSGSNSFRNDPVNSFTPFGSVTYSQNDDGSWNQYVKLSENQQKMLNQQEKFGIQSGDTATDDTRLNSALGQFVTPLDTSNLFNLGANQDGTPMGTALAQSFGLQTSGFNPETYGRAYDTLLTNYTQGMEGERDRQASNRAQQLANQGIRQGSTAYDRALSDFNDTWYDNLSKAQQQAAADAYKYSSEDASLNNAAATQALQNAISANQANLEQQTLENTYLYKLLEALMGNTSVTLPQGYSGAPLSGTGNFSQEGTSSQSSGGLLNSIGSYFR